MSAPAAILDEMREALRSNEVRVEFGQTWSLSRGVIETAQILTRSAPGARQWRRVGPLLVAPEDNPTRVGLLSQLAQLAGAA